MLLYQVELIKYGYKTLLEFLKFKSSGDHMGDQAHFHSTLEIMLICEGKGIYKVSGSEYPFTEGDVFIFNSMEAHNIQSLNGNCELEYIAVNFDSNFVSSMSTDEFNLQYLEPFCFTDRPCKIPHGSFHAKNIQVIFEDMQKEFELKPPCYSLFIKALLIKLLAVIGRYYQENGGYGQAYQEPIMPQDSIALVLDYIEKNLTSELSIDQLSKVAAMNRYYFSTFFKKHVGETPVQYITRKRVNLSIQILNKDNLNILDVAIRSGFNNTANFNRVFKQMTGYSPTEYRKQFLKKK